jgi:hypothetical protein
MLPQQRQQSSQSASAYEQPAKQRQMNRSQKEALKERIEKLEAQEHAQIFEIIKRYTENYTKTQTGVLVSSEALTDECLHEIERMVTFFADQKKRMDSDNAERKALTRTQYHPSS